MYILYCEQAVVNFTFMYARHRLQLAMIKIYHITAALSLQLDLSTCSTPNIKALRPDTYSL